MKAQVQYNVSSIIKNAPIAIKHRTPGKPSANPIYRNMEKLANSNVGSSFIIEGAALRDVHPKVYAASKRFGIKILTRTVDKGIQVWRVDESDTGDTSQ